MPEAAAVAVEGPVVAVEGPAVAAEQVVAAAVVALLVAGAVAEFRRCAR